MIPRLFFTGHATLLFLSAPPSVPRSSNEPSRHNVACRLASPVRREKPAIHPRLLMLLPRLFVPPSESRYDTWYCCAEVVRASANMEHTANATMKRPRTVFRVVTCALMLLSTARELRLTSSSLKSV